MPQEAVGESVVDKKILFCVKDRKCVDNIFPPLYQQRTWAAWLFKTDISALNPTDILFKIRWKMDRMAAY
jgi:hypothetical protein